MFTYIRVKNFKSLIDFSIDFRNNRNKTKNLVVIYGENGSGKTNIVEVFEFLKNVLFTRRFSIDFSKINLGENDKIEEKIFDIIIKKHSINSIISSYKTIDSSEDMHVECGFKKKNKEYKYIIITNNEQIIYEQLNLLSKNNIEEVLFEINLKDKNIDKVIGDSNYLIYLKDELDKYWGKNSFLSIIFHELSEKTESYVKKNIKTLIDTIDEFLSFSVFKHSTSKEKISIVSGNNILLDNIQKGVVEQKRKHILDLTEKILNSVALLLYSDMVKVFYKRESKDSIIAYSLYCRKKIGDRVLDIEFDRESTGTQKLFKLVPLFVEALLDRIIIIDEFDTGIHDLMVKELLETFAEKIKGQLILTTHNTTLMESDIKKESIYILDILSDRNKEALSVADYEKPYSDKNTRKRYLDGLYGGIPQTSYIDTDEIEELVKDEKRKN